MIFIGTRRAFLSYKIASDIFPKLKANINILTLKRIPEICNIIFTSIGQVSMNRKATRKEDDNHTKQ